MWLMGLLGLMGADYKKAPDAMRAVLDAAPAPTAQVVPGGKAVLLAHRKPYPAVREVARPFHRLAGLRIDPVAQAQHLATSYERFDLQPLDGGKLVPLKIHAGLKPGLPEWSPDGKRYALEAFTGKGTFLHLGTAEGGFRQTLIRLNSVLGDPIQWMPNGETLLCLVSPYPPRPVPRSPSAPIVQDADGADAPARTYQDLLKDETDAKQLEQLGHAQIALVDDLGKPRLIGKAGLIRSVSPSPDGKYLLVQRIKRPFSYSLPLSYFPLETVVIDLTGTHVRDVADLPLADKVPIEGVRTGPRSVAWHPTKASTLVWIEALDGGDPRKKAEKRDRVVTRDIAEKEPKTLLETEHRCTGVTWLEDGRALVAEYERDKRRRRTWLVGEKPELLFDRSAEDRYRDPGTPMTKRTKTGHRVVRLDEGCLLLRGDGASPKGARPFLDKYDIKGKKATRLFHSAADAYESVVSLLSDDGSRFLTRHESPTSPPNWRVHEKGKEPRAVTSFKDELPALRKISRKLVTYKRPDGVALSFTLYLPPDHKEGTKLPTLVWAYPREFADPAAAGQVVGSPNRFTTLAGSSHLFLLLAGYAVLDGASMPVVGSPEKANDTFVEQIAASAKAAIDKADELGVCDRTRVAVGGHSYGAFMTANLLAHTDLFKAGVARSGAYNRTLTPFGFQNERRTLWQAPEVYARMSPFMHADKIKSPLLLIHGSDDNNSGTFPLQSERLFSAIKGTGGTARLVMLPHESHGYAARESIEHVLAETTEWLDKHVKKPRKRGDFDAR